MAATLSDLPMRVGLRTVAANLEDALVGIYAFHREVVPLLSSVMSEPELLAQYRQRLVESGQGPQLLGAVLAGYLSAEQRMGRVDKHVDTPTVAEILMAMTAQRAHLAAFFNRPPRSIRGWARPVVRAILSGTDPR
jgi:hypothetical protein